MKSADETDRVRRYYESSARRYEAWIAVFEGAMLGDRRRALCAQAQGRVLEIAIGTGRNLPFYAAGIDLVGIDLSPAMLAVAQRRADQLQLSVDLRVGDAHSLDFPDASFDSVVCTLSLSTIPDDGRALAEASRVLRPGGRLLLLEHVRSPWRAIGLLQRMIDPLMVRWTGDHWLREPLGHLGRLGFVVERCERSRLGIIESVTARKPR